MIKPKEYIYPNPKLEILENLPNDRRLVMLRNARLTQELSLERCQRLLKTAGFKKLMVLTSISDAALLKMVIVRSNTWCSRDDKKQPRVGGSGTYGSERTESKKQRRSGRAASAIVRRRRGSEGSRRRRHRGWGEGEEAPNPRRNEEGDGDGFEKEFILIDRSIEREREHKRRKFSFHRPVSETSGPGCENVGYDTAASLQLITGRIVSKDPNLYLASRIRVNNSTILTRMWILIRFIFFILCLTLGIYTYTPLYNLIFLILYLSFIL